MVELKYGRLRRQPERSEPRGLGLSGTCQISIEALVALLVRKESWTSTAERGWQIELCV